MTYKIESLDKIFLVDRTMLASMDFIFPDKKNINPALLCDICKNPLKNPRALPCSCVYCYDCVVRVASRKHLVCPICKKKYSLKDLTAVNRPLQMILDQLHVQCSNSGSSKVEQAKFDEHFSEGCKQPLPATTENINHHSLARANDNAADATQSVSSMTMIKQHPESNESVPSDELNPFSNLHIPDSPRSINTDTDTVKTQVDEHGKSTKVTTDTHAKSPIKGKFSCIFLLNHVQIK